MRPDQTESLSRDPRDATAAKTRAELGTEIDPAPTSLQDEYDNGGWSNQSPQESEGGFHGGTAGRNPAAQT